MADMRKGLSKLKVVELKEKLQELGKIPKGLKADLINQLAEAYEEQSTGMADTTAQLPAPLQPYQTTAPISEAMMTSETPESQHYYQQSVGQYSMPGQQVYEQPPNYMQPSYEQQYQYPTHQVFSPTHEQQYNQSTAPYQMTSQLSPRIASQMSPQLSPQMANPLVPPIQPQITQQLSPQMAAQQFRPADFQSPHRGFQSNESDAYHTEYGGQTTPEQMSHYALPHMEMHAIPTTQPANPPSLPPQMVHRPPVMDSYPPDIPQAQSLPPNIAPDMSAFKQENDAFIPTHPSMVPTEAPTDIIDFDDVSIGMDPTSEVPFNQPIGVFDQNQPEFEITDPSDQFPRDVNDGQAFSQNDPMQDLVTEDTNDDTNEGTNDDSTDVDSNDTNQSFPNEVIGDVIKPIESNFSEHQIISETSDPIKIENESQLTSEVNQTMINTNNESSIELNKFDENDSSDMIEADVEPEKDSNEMTDDLIDNESNNEIKMESNQLIESQQTFETKDSHQSPESEIMSQNQVIKSIEESPQPSPEEQPLEELHQVSDIQQPLESPKLEEEPRLQTTIEIAEEEKSPPKEEPPSPPTVETYEPPIETKQVPPETKQVPTETKQVPTETKQVLTETKQAPIETKQAPIEIKQAPIEIKQVSIETKLVSIETKQVPIVTRQQLNDLVVPVVSQTIDSTRIENKTFDDKSVSNVRNESQNNVSVKQNGFIETKDNKKLNKNQKKKLRKKLRANRRVTEQKTTTEKKVELENDDRMDIDEEDEEEEVEIEYVPESIKKDPIYFHYLKVFDKFRTGESDRSHEEEVYVDPVKKMMERKKPVEMDLKDEDERKDGEQKISKRKLKQMTRMTVAELKQRVSHPELVEMHDVTAKDPLLLLHLKATRNSVPVPRHWCYKRKYLQGKRGFEKPPFKLPEFIRRTGIMEMRQALQDKEESKSLKAQMREKIRPKMGKIDIDYQKLHDAFFKWQTKPKMTIHGDLYYEGKEFETRLKEKKPGELSTELRTSLGMPTGPNANKCPPPWLIAMQRYGPPPSYPNIKIPGLNAPIPDGCSFGYHAGGWGKPPVDEYGRPLYGDVFGTTSTTDQNVIEEEVDRTLWGEMDSESEEEESSSEEEEETEATAAAGKAPAKEVDESGFVTPAEGLATPSGLTSVPTGMETPDMIELRKRKQIEAEMESGDNPALYTVIPEKKGDKVGREMMASAHTYDMSAATLRKGQGIDVALDPSDLEAGSLDSASVAARYEQTMKEQSSHLAKEDLSDMVAEHAARQKRKKQQDTSKSSKKYQFKF